MRPFKWAYIWIPDHYNTHEFVVEVSDVDDPQNHNAACLYDKEEDEEIRERIAAHCPAVKDATVVTYHGFRDARDCVEFCKERNLTVL